MEEVSPPPLLGFYPLEVHTLWRYVSRLNSHFVDGTRVTKVGKTRFTKVKKNRVTKGKK